MVNHPNRSKSRALGMEPLSPEHRTAQNIVAIFACADRHPQAVSYELHRVPVAELVKLAYREHSIGGHADWPDKLAELAYDEIERRQHAIGALLVDNPSIAEALR